MFSTWANSFRLLAISLLSLAAFGKLASLMTGSKLLQSPDPILPFTNGTTMTLAILLESFVVVTLLVSNSCRIQLIATCWLACIFATYRIALTASGITAPCGCLGVFALFMRNGGEKLSMLILAILIIGSTSLLVWDIRNERVLS